MTPTDLSDVNANTYTYLLNGVAPAGNWTGLFKPGERCCCVSSTARR